MILVDTSIWIDYLSSRPSAGAQRLDAVVAAGLEFAITPVIIQEVLQGARSRSEFARLRQALVTQNIVYPHHPVESHIAAAEIYVRCRGAGITPSGAVDCFIAQVAIENRATLLHNDADFNHIAQVVPALRIQ